MKKPYGRGKPKALAMHGMVPRVPFPLQRDGEREDCVQMNLKLTNPVGGGFPELKGTPKIRLGIRLPRISDPVTPGCILGTGILVTYTPKNMGGASPIVRMGEAGPTTCLTVPPPDN